MARAQTPATLSSGGFANLFDRRLQKALSEIGVIDDARQGQRADHRRENGHSLALGLLPIRLGNHAVEDFEICLDPGFE